MTAKIYQMSDYRIKTPDDLMREIDRLLRAADQAVVETDRLCAAAAQIVEELSAMNKGGPDGPDSPRAA